MVVGQVVCTCSLLPCGTGIVKCKLVTGFLCQRSSGNPPSHNKNYITLTEGLAQFFILASEIITSLYLIFFSHTCYDKNQIIIKCAYSHMYHLLSLVVVSVNVNFKKSTDLLFCGNKVCRLWKACVNHECYMFVFIFILNASFHWQLIELQTIFPPANCNTITVIE